MSFNEAQLKDLLGGKGYIRGPFGSALKRAELKEDGVPVYEQQHAIRGDRDFRYFIDEEKYEKLKRFTVETNDLIISCSGTVGRISVIREGDPKGIISQALLILRPDAEKVLPEYLYYFFSSKRGFNELINASQGAVQLNIAPRAVVEKIPVPIPCIEEQKTIVAILKGVDDKIELNRQTNQTLEQIAQAIFKSWFVDFEPTRAKIIAKEQGADSATQELAAQAIICGAITLEQLQGYAEESVEESAQQREQESLSTRLQKAINEKLSQASAHPLNATTAEQLIATAALFPNELVESELGEVPKGWEVKALDEIAHYQNGLALQKFRPENDEESLPVLKIAQLRKGFADGEERASANIKPECIVDNGDVVFSWSGSLIVDIWCGGKVALNQHLFKVTSQNYPKWFYHYWTKRHLEVFQQIAADKAVTMGHIKREHLSQAKCLVPADNLLELGVINNLLEKQVLLNLENFSLENIRDALLPKLLSGELRVNSGSHIT